MCGPDNKPTPPRQKLRIAWADFLKLYDSNQVILVDVRDTKDFEEGHIPGARSFPLNSIEERAGELKKRRQTIVLYCGCTAEQTSARGVLLLQEHGIQAKALTGGYAKWLQDSKGKIEKGKGKPLPTR
jgi:rhodanese-related sulfurtransferase